MKKIKRTHRFFRKHPMAAALLLMASFLFLSVPAGLIGGLVGLVFPGIGELSGALGTVIAGFLALGIYKLWFSPEFEGNLRGGKPVLSLGPAMIFVALWVVVFADMWLCSGVKPVIPTISNLGFALAAGISEEVFLRGLPLSLLMAGRTDRKWAVSSLVITSGTFGLIHALNLLSGADPVLTLTQILGTAGMGMLLGGIYLRTGNLIPVMLLHSIHDAVAFFNPALQETGGVMAQASAPSLWDLLMLTVPYLIMAAAGLWLLRRKKSEEVRKLWTKKWSAAL